MTYLQRRQFKYFGAFSIFALLAGISTFWFTHSFENTIKKQVSELQTLAQLEVQAVQTQYLFKKQIQEWKNILLRGHVQTDFERYLSLFEKESENTRQAALNLYDSIEEDGEAKKLTKRFIAKHSDMFVKYLKSLEEFESSGFDSKSADILVRGVDRIPTELLDEVVEDLSLDIKNSRDGINRQLVMNVASYSLSIILIICLFSFIFFRLVNALLKSSFTDKTTDSGNRELFISLVNDAICSKTAITVALLDINNFKLINEAFGSAGGDKYLNGVSSIIKRELSKRETVSRIGGDCIGIVLYDEDSEKAIARIEQIQSKISAYKYSENGIHLSCTASIGVVCMHQSMESNAEQLLNNLYASLQEAQERGSNKIVVYSKYEANILQRRSQMQSVADINQALEEKRIVLFRQEVSSLLSEENDNYFEILIRVKDAEGEMIPPGKFILAAERFSLMSKIDYCILSHVIDCQLKHGADSPVYSVNLSGSTLSDKGFINRLHQIFNDPRLEHKKLSFEITETDIVKNFDIANEVIRTLKSYGCMIALDDFGAGMSSYAYLASLDIDTIKIDGLLTRHIDKKPANQSIIRSIVNLANELNIKTVAEFVETEHELEVLTRIGVDYVQGFYIDRPKLIYDPSLECNQTKQNLEKVA